MKKVLVFAGNHHQADNFIKEHRFLSRETAEYCCSDNRFDWIRAKVEPVGYVLIGEFWLNPAYRGNEFHILEQRGLLNLLKSEKEICDFLGVEWIPADLGIKIEESVDSKDKLL